MKIEIETFDDYRANITLTVLDDTYEEVWSVHDEDHLCTEGISIEAQIAKKHPFKVDVIGEFLGVIDIEALCELHHKFNQTLIEDILKKRRR